MGEEITGLVCGVLAMCIPIVAIIAWHQQRTMEMRLKMGGPADPKLVNEMSELKAQMAALRDTSTQYDISFDAALQRIENRVATLEGRVNRLDHDTDEQAERIRTTF